MREFNKKNEIKPASCSGKSENARWSKGGFAVPERPGTREGLEREVTGARANWGENSLRFNDAGRGQAREFYTRESRTLLETKERAEEKDLKWNVALFVARRRLAVAQYQRLA